MNKKIKKINEISEYQINRNFEYFPTFTQKIAKYTIKSFK